jgi:hypothetical protein
MRKAEPRQSGSGQVPGGFWTKKSPSVTGFLMIEQSAQ